MNQKTKLELQGKVELEVVQNPQVACHKCGSSNYEEKGLTKAGTQRYCCLDCKARFVQLFALVKGEDIWLAEDLGLHIHPHRINRGTKFNFHYISQHWFKEIVKRFIKYKASTGLSFERLMRHLGAFNDFS